jgi:hypothetical protein
MRPSRTGSTLYWGYGKDGIWRTCKFDYHKDSEILKAGTANAIAHTLKFKNVLEMKNVMLNELGIDNTSSFFSKKL